MEALAERPIACPYCGETIEVLIDTSVGEQYYTEDCQVCCQPIAFSVTIDGGQITLDCWPENE